MADKKVIKMCKKCMLIVVKKQALLHHHYPYPHFKLFVRLLFHPFVYFQLFSYLNPCSYLSLCLLFEAFPQNGMSCSDW